MSITGGIIIYVNLWMIIFFMVLPFGITNQIDSQIIKKAQILELQLNLELKKRF
jgi:predicted secreted protein